MLIHRGGGGTVTDVLLLLLALVLTAACAVFVAAEFSLTTVERGALERAAEAGERGAATALKAARRLTFQLSGAQLGITITSLVIGMVAQPSVAALLHGPLEALGLPSGVVNTVGILLGVLLSTVVLMVAGELVPKNWAISRPLAVAKVVAGPQYYFSAAFSPLIGHLNNTANHVVRRLGLEPAEHLASARTPQELVALARHSARAGAIEPDTAELFVRSLNLRELTAENVMTPGSTSGPWRSTPRRPTSPTSPVPPACPASPSTATTSTRSSARSTSRTRSPSPPTGVTCTRWRT